MNPNQYCKNCGAELTGQFCSGCGQCGDTHIVTLWEFFRDLADDLWSMDSRIWHTLVPLVTRPGLLTTEFMQGKRSRYLPPLRTYLLLSLTFFIIASLDRDWVSVNGGETNLGDNIFVLEEDFDTNEALGQDSDIPATGDAGAEEDICATLKVELPAWFDTSEFRDRMRGACEKITKDDGASLSSAMVDNLPGMMFFFLPLIALIMKILFMLSGRLYVEHLMFLVHYHAFGFLILIINSMLSRLGSLVAGLMTVTDWLEVAAVVYLPVYLFIALKRVYGQGIGLTTLKYILLIGGYIISLGLNLFAVFIYTALTI